jgi:hypothetical protein
MSERYTKDELQIAYNMVMEQFVKAGNAVDREYYSYLADKLSARIQEATI